MGMGMGMRTATGTTPMPIPMPLPTLLLLPAPAREGRGSWLLGLVWLGLASCEFFLFFFFFFFFLIPFVFFSPGQDEDKMWKDGKGKWKKKKRRREGVGGWDRRGRLRRMRRDYVKAKLTTSSSTTYSEKLLKLDARAREYDIVVIGEEPHVAYNRVGLTSFFEHRLVENLYLNPLEWVCFIFFFSASPSLSPFFLTLSKGVRRTRSALHR